MTASLTVIRPNDPLWVWAGSAEGKLWPSDRHDDNDEDVVSVEKEEGGSSTTILENPSRVDVDKNTDGRDYKE